MSPSLRGRGLKSILATEKGKSFKVALFARAWIEMVNVCPSNTVVSVALFARAWIEI